MKLSTSTEWLFFHLWKMNPETGQSCPNVLITDTVIYRWAQPYFWYYTVLDEQDQSKGKRLNTRIERKTKEKVAPNALLKKFKEQKNWAEKINENMRINVKNNKQNVQDKDKVAACYMTSQVNPKNKNQEKVIFEYFTKKDFANFLFRREKSLDAVLQRFVEPKGTRNQMIKVIWSPQFCLMYRKTNIHEMKNQKTAFNDKLVTFEGAEHLSIADSISSPLLAQDLEQTCVNIVKHIQDVSGGTIQVQRMILYFKHDVQNRLWLMFCTGLKVREKQATLIGIQNQEKKEKKVSSPLLSIKKKQIQSQLTEKEKLEEMRINHKNITRLEVKNNSICTNCEKNSTKLYDIKFKYLIENFEKGILKNEEEKEESDMSEDSQEDGIKPKIPMKFKQFDDLENEMVLIKQKDIPTMIIKAWGNINVDKYEQLKQNPSWLNITTKVCDDCYMKLTEITIISQYKRCMAEKQKSMKNESKKAKQSFDQGRKSSQDLITQKQQSFIYQQVQSKKSLISKKSLHSRKSLLLGTKKNLGRNPKLAKVKPKVYQFQNYKKRNNKTASHLKKRSQNKFTKSKQKILNKQQLSENRPVVKKKFILPKVRTTKPKQRESTQEMLLNNNMDDDFNNTLLPIDLESKDTLLTHTLNDQQKKQLNQTSDIIPSYRFPKKKIFRRTFMKLFPNKKLRVHKMTKNQIDKNLIGVYFNNSKFEDRFPLISRQSKERRRGIHLSCATGKFYMMKRKPLHKSREKLQSRSTNYSYLKSTVKDLKEKFAEELQSTFCN